MAVHTASVMSMDPNPHNVIPQVISAATNVLKAAFAEPGVYRFVYLSSCSAALLSSTDTPGIIITEQSWCEELVRDAWAPPPYEPSRGLQVYAASKAQGEQAVWKYYNEHRYERPDLVVNTGQSQSCYTVV